MKRLIVFGLSVVLLGAGFSTVHARTITPFTDFQEWLAASVQVGTVRGEFFDEFTSDQSFAVPPNSNSVLGPPVDVGPFFLQAFGRPTALSDNKIDTVPFEGPFDINFTPYAFMLVEQGPTIDTSVRVIMAFNQPVLAWGADFRRAGGPDKVALLLFPGDPNATFVEVAVPDVSVPSFFGFVSDTPISVIHFTEELPRGGNVFGVDDVFFAVPEEGSTFTFILLGGAFGLLLIAWRRQFFGT